MEPATTTEPVTTVYATSSTPTPSRRVSPAVVVPVAALASLSVLLLRNPERRAAVARFAATTAEDLGSTAASAGQAVKSGTRTTTVGAQHLATTVAGTVVDVVKPVSTALAAGVGSVLPIGSSAAATLTQKEASVMESTRTTAREARQALRNVPRMAEVQTLVKTEVSRQLASHLSQHHVELEQQLQQHFTQHEAAIDALGTQLAQLSRELSRETLPRRGGIPWRLLLLAGAGYYLWRNPQARQKMMDYVQQVRPGAQEKLQNAGQSVREGVDRLRSGSSSAGQEGQAGAGQVQETPGQTMGGSAGQGAMSGMPIPGATLAPQQGTPDLDSSVGGQSQTGPAPTSGKINPNNRR